MRLQREQRCQTAKDNYPINVAPNKLYSTLQPNKIPETIAIPVYRCSYWLETILLPISLAVEWACQNVYSVILSLNTQEAMCTL